MKRTKKNFKREYMGLIINIGDFNKILSLLIDNDFKYEIEHGEVVIDEDEDFLDLFEDDWITNIELTASLKQEYGTLYLRINSNSANLTSYNLNNDKIYSTLHKINDIIENKQNKYYLIFKEPYNFISYVFIIIIILIILHVLIKEEKIYYLLILLTLILEPILYFYVEKRIIKNKIIKFEYKSYTTSCMDYLKNNIGGIFVGVIATVIGGLILHYLI